MIRRRGRDPQERNRELSVARRQAREMVEAALKGNEEAEFLLVDVLPAAEEPELAEALSLVRQGLGYRPDARGKPFGSGALGPREQRMLLLERIDSALSYPSRAFRDDHEAEERRRALTYLRRIERSWSRSSSAERLEDMANAVTWLQMAVTNPDAIEERFDWLMDGTFGQGEQLLARDIIDLPATRNREAALVQLLLALDDRVPPEAAPRVWRALGPDAQAALTRLAQNALRQRGASIRERATRRRRT